MRVSAQPAFACSNSIELTSTMFKVNNKDTRTTSFDVFLVFYVNFKQIYTSCTIADVDQVNIQRVECSITLVGNDVLPRSLQLKHFCNMSNCVMSKIRAITLNTWWKRFIMIIIKLLYFEIFTSCQGLMQTFSKHYSKCKTVSINFRKTLQESRLPISKLPQDSPKNNF